MVQILNKMVHLKYPILEIWCCHKHITQNFASFKAEIWHKVEENVPKQSGSLALHKSFSQEKYCFQFCLFVLANQMQASITQVFGYLCICHSSQMPSSRLKCGKKLRNTSPKRFVSTARHKSLLQAEYAEYCL